MNLFKKKEIKFNENISDVKILGSNGCGSCEALFNNVKIALKELNVDLEPNYIKDIEVVKEYNIMSIPALVINEKVVSVGKSLSVQKIKEILSKEYIV